MTLAYLHAPDALLMNTIVTSKMTHCRQTLPLSLVLLLLFSGAELQNNSRVESCTARSAYRLLSPPPSTKTREHLPHDVGRWQYRAHGHVGRQDGVSRQAGPEDLLEQAGVGGSFAEALCAHCDQTSLRA